MTTQEKRKALEAYLDPDVIDTLNDLDVENEYAKHNGLTSEDAIANQSLDDDPEHVRNMKNIGGGSYIPGQTKFTIPVTKTSRDFNAAQDKAQRLNEIANQPEADVKVNVPQKASIASQPIVTGGNETSAPAQSTNTTTATTPTPTTSSNADKPKSSVYRPKSILQAYYDEDFGEVGSDESKSTRNYLLADAFGNFARNLGKDIGNVGAQYTGGTVDNDRGTSQWDARNAEMMKQGISAEAATVDNSDKNIQRQKDVQAITSAKLANRLSEMKITVPEQYKKLIENADKIDNPAVRAAIKGGAATLLDKSVNGGEVTPAQFIAAVSAYGGNELAEYAASQNKTVEQVLGDMAKSFISKVK